MIIIPVQNRNSDLQLVDIDRLIKKDVHISQCVSPVKKVSYCLMVSVHFSHSVVSTSLRPHGLQHARTSCPSPTPGVYSNLCPLSRWCHPAISSSVVLFSSCPQSFSASGSSPVSQLFTSGGQSIGVSASTSVLSVNTRDWSPLGWLFLLAVQGTLKSLL